MRVNDPIAQVVLNSMWNQVIASLRMAFAVKVLRRTRSGGSSRCLKRFAFDRGDPAAPDCPGRFCPGRFWL